MRTIRFIIPCVAVVLSWVAALSKARAQTSMTPTYRLGADALQTGDLSPVHAAYQQGDIEALWQFYLNAHEGRYVAGSAFSPASRGHELNRRIEEYAARLLAQFPGHARHIGDKIDKLVPKIDFRSTASNAAVAEFNQWLRALSDFATPECVQQLCRFLWDKRAILSDDEARSLWDRPAIRIPGGKDFYMPPLQSGERDAPLSGVSYAVAMNLNGLIAERLFSPLPFPEAALEKESRLDLVRNIRRWWRSDAAKQFREAPTNGRRKDEPVPEKIDLGTLPEIERAIIYTKRFAPLHDPVEAEQQAILSGDLAVIHAAYERRDLDALWRIFIYASLPQGAAVGFAPQAHNPALTPGQWKELNRRVLEYVKKLIGQIPGHAKFYGDRIEALSARPDLQRSATAAVARGMYFEFMASLGSQECLRELGRFMHDSRGGKPLEELDQANQQEAGPKGGFWIDRRDPVPNGWEAARGIELALGEAFPLAGAMTDKDKRYRCMSWRPDGRKAVEEWWFSDDARKYREPRPLQEPPKEPLPERIDVTSLKGQ